MRAPESETQTVVLEKTFPYAPVKVWRALTESNLLAQWLMSNDFEAVPGRSFQFRAQPMAQWDGVIDCSVIALDPPRSLTYTWRSLGLDSVVHFTLTAVEGGTHLRMTQTGFRPEQQAAFKGATYGWQKFLGAMERVLKEELS
jgi:uncharacterized protein YndB with AHSA1/START domain